MKIIKETKDLINMPIDWNTQYSQDTHFSEVVIWSSHIPIKIYNKILCSMGKRNLKFIWEVKLEYLCDTV